MLAKSINLGTTLLVLLMIGGLSSCGGGNSAECRHRAAALNARVEEIKHKAHDTLKIGSTRDEVTRFYNENDIPLTFDRSGARGTIGTTGCSPVGCGSNDAIIGVSVPLDSSGKVNAEPYVMAMYTDCL